MEKFKSAVIVLINKKSSENRIDKIRDFLVSQMELLTFQVNKILMVHENLQELGNELCTFSKQYDILLVVDELDNNIIFDLLRNIFGNKMKSNGTLSLTRESNDFVTLPPAAKLLTNDDLPFPVIYLQRIFVLKEKYVEIQFLDILKSHLQQYASHPVFKKTVEVQMNGNSKRIIEDLRKLANVELQNENGLSKLIITSQSFENLVQCEKMLKYELRENYMGSKENTALFKAIYNTKEQHIISSLKAIEESLVLYGPENVFLSFNGGKDCTVLLHLVHTVMNLKYPDYKKSLLCLYVKSKEAFAEQGNFISQCQIFYNLDIIVSDLNIKDALSRILSEKPYLKAVFMGTRRTDPYSQHLNILQMTDPNWPQVMRVSPLLDWHYADIWDYLLFYKVPYCKLYDLGYTSLGSSSNTIRNLSLAYYDSNKQQNEYFPAYKLINESEERNGRNVGI